MMNRKPTSELKQRAREIYANEKSGYSEKYFSIMYELAKRGWVHYLENDGKLAFRLKEIKKEVTKCQEDFVTPNVGISDGSESFRQN